MLDIKYYTSAGRIDSNKLRESWITKNDTELYSEILELITKLDCSFKEGLFLFINELDEIPKCKTCGCKLLYKGSTQKGYGMYCSNECILADKTIGIRKIENMKKTVKEKYGVDNFFQTEVFKEKAKETSLKKYGTEFTSQSDIVKDKISNSVINKYGSKQNLGKITYKKSIETLQKKHNDINITNMMHVPDAKNKLSRNVRLANLESYIERLKNKDLLLLSTPDDYINNGAYAEYDFKCNKCNHVFRTQMSYNYFASCPVCTKNQYNSKLEEEICEYIYSIDKSIKIITNDRKILNGLELDIYLPDYNLAIEFDGLMYHSIGNRIFYRDDNTDSEGILKDYHLNKTTLCSDKNIQLFHIFENEWLNKNTREIWQSIIANKLGYSKTIYGRKTIVKEVDIATARDFIEKNHLQGFVNAGTRIGLFYNDELVSLMTFGKSRYNKNYTYELVRYANKKGLNVIGGASKIFNYFKKNILKDGESIITYGDKRFSIGKIYETLGFSKLEDSNPNYFYFNESTYHLESRVKYQKHKLKDILSIFDDNISESMNMYNNGYRKIYDCGNVVYFYKK